MSSPSEFMPSLRAAAGLLEDVLCPGDEGIEMAGDVIGVYRLIEKLGEGGFGVVWRAEQAEPIKREVALKIIKLGMDTLEVMRRFEQERQALALMDHQNIASVFHAGATPEGRPFFVMELVHGVSVTQYCIEKALPLDARLNLFQDICSGVQHAHQKGVIHRDLKPSNVIVTEVDGLPVPKIIDFGIAKATTTDSLNALTLVTRVDQMMGTPLYMSPEQAAASADIDTRSDVYALGVLLYELLTGQPPFDAETLLKAGMDEMRRIIREVDPVRPSQKGPKELKGQKGPSPTESLSSLLSFKSLDLDLITLRALEKDRTRRYESASALGEDIQRFLNHEPVQARAPSMAYVAQRWVRRHRVVAAAALICLLAIVGGASVALWQAREARRQAREADAALAVALEVLSSTVDLEKGRLVMLRSMIDRASEKAAKLSGTPERMTELHFVLAKA
ncbi:MAG: serine/threonine protein kinase [Verrucomicrobiaceae bacterium]|nr:serine/threonine protein kinase [Verrucomicrobiaceae bacterium]